ncbi:unnamed protein product [Lasius platythorax]
MALTILCLLGLLAFSQAGVLKPYFDPRIVNGEDAKEGEIPYQVSLQDRQISSHFCGGSVLSEYYVITAAHCVEGKSASGVKVIAATTNLHQPQLTNEVTQIRVHEKYNPSDSWINDIALLKVKDSFKTSATLQYVPLPPKGHVVNANDVAVVSGWGRIRQGGPTTEKLQRVNIVIADQTYCSNVYKSMGYNVYSTQVCAYDPKVEKGSCHGDSGGPLTVDGKLVGLVSWARGCASTAYPTVYTRVVSYLDWIKSNAV